MRLLREELEYDGLVFSDDIEMKALSGRYSVEECSVGALAAGVDAILVCSRADLREEVLGRLEGAADHILEAPLRRMAAFKAQLASRRDVLSGLDPQSPPFPEHERLARRLAGSSIEENLRDDPTERA
jgi:beta-N-acetylhexosaminidase